MPSTICCPGLAGDIIVYVITKDRKFVLTLHDDGAVSRLNDDKVSQPVLLRIQSKYYVTK